MDRKKDPPKMIQIPHLKKGEKLEPKGHPKLIPKGKMRFGSKISTNVHLKLIQNSTPPKRRKSSPRRLAEKRDKHYKILARMRIRPPETQKILGNRSENANWEGQPNARITKNIREPQ